MRFVRQEPEMGDDGDEVGPPHDKFCSLCERLACEASFLDKVAGLPYRSWALQRFWGPFCWACKRAAAVRFAHMNTGTFVRWLDSDPQNRMAAKWASFAFMTLRSEGKTQASVEQLESRVSLLQMSMVELPKLLGEPRFAFMLLEDFCKANPATNLVAAGLHIIEMEVGGVKRLGVRVPQPHDHTITAQSPMNVCIASGVMCNHPQDSELLMRCASTAPMPKYEIGPSPAKSRKKTGDIGADEDAAESDFGSSACDGGVGSSSVAGGSAGPAPIFRRDVEDWQAVLPKGKDGNKVRTAMNKVSGMLTHLSSEQWRTVMRDATLRAALRGGAGLGKELQSTEHVALIALVSEMVQALSCFHRTAKVTSGLQRGQSMANCATIVEPLDFLAGQLQKRVGNDKALDAELVLLRASLASASHRPIGNLGVRQGHKTSCPLGQCLDPQFRGYPHGHCLNP